MSLHFAFMPFIVWQCLPFPHGLGLAKLDPHDISYMKIPSEEHAVLLSYPQETSSCEVASYRGITTAFIVISKMRIAVVKLIQKDEDLNKMPITTRRIYLEHLKIKGILHLRGVIELWETEHMDHIHGNRGKKWTKFFENKENLKIFQNFWSKPDDIDIERAVDEMQSFYKFLSEKIHISPRDEFVEWNRDMLTPVRNKIAEYM
ncbi:5443_t:CDS:2, partial [Funneliformis geosporum]